VQLKLKVRQGVYSHSIEFLAFSVIISETRIISLEHVPPMYKTSESQFSTHLTCLLCCLRLCFLWLLLCGSVLVYVLLSGLCVCVFGLNLVSLMMAEKAENFD
jgi:hypothetical protein